MKARRVKGKPYTPYEVAIPKKITGTTRKRKYFATTEEAAAFIVRVKQTGYQGADIRENESAPGILTLGECTAMWLARHEGKSGDTKAQLKTILKRLDAKFGRTDIMRINHRDLDQWMQAVPGGYMNHINHWKITRRFFAFAQNWLEVIPRNPMAKVPRPEGERNAVQILTPARMVFAIKAALMLEEELRWPIVAYLGLGGFGGLRPIETQRADYADVKEEVFVPRPKKTKGGFRPRYVEILPALASVLAMLPKKDGKVIPWDQRNFYEKMEIFRKKIVEQADEKSEKEFWSSWPDNCLRHSYRTYHVAHFQNIEKTRVQMGHARDEMTTYQYGGAITRRIAAEWWEIDAAAIFNSL